MPCATLEKATASSSKALSATQISPDGTNEVIGNPNGLDQSTVLGSVSILHVKSGLNLTLAAGHRDWHGAVVDADGVLRTPEDTKYIYTKLGWIANLNPLGNTAFLREYGWFSDYVTAVADGDIVTS